jgi:hypothetical protein
MMGRQAGGGNAKFDALVRVAQGNRCPIGDRGIYIHIPACITATYGTML